MSLPLNTKLYPLYPCQYQTRTGYTIGVAQDGPKVTSIVVIRRPITVLKIRGKERDYVLPHPTTTLKSWISFLNEAKPRLGITKTAELFIYALGQQLEAKANENQDTT